MNTAATPEVAGSLGLVVIGRNEGERLQRCLRSVQAEAATVVYVDSGSTDGSATWARGIGAVVVDMDLSRPFTAARARNEGFQRLMAVAPGVRHVQFVDGDCEVVAGWLRQAQGFLDQRPEVAAVCGRRRERHPERSVYNRLCDQEWDTPVGEAKACGGDVMMRVAALQQAGGYRDSLIAGEEPELCVRLRAAGWKIWRLDAEMTLHDAAMLRWSQWWRRTRRAGYAFAEGAHLHGATAERHWVREHRRAWLWGAVPPLIALLGLPVMGLPALLVLLVYPLQILRLFFRTGGPFGERALAAVFVVLGKLPEAQGALDFLRDRLLQRRGALIEYK